MIKKQDTLITSITTSELEQLKSKAITRDAIRDKLNCSDNNSIIIAEVNKFIGLEKTVADKDKQLQQVQSQAITLEIQLEEKAKLLKDAEKQVATLTVEVGKSQQTIDILQEDYKVALASIQDLKARCQMPVLKGFKLWLYNILTKGV